MNPYLGKPYELRAAGVKALKDVLGDEAAQEFLTLWRGIPGADFNKWRAEQPPQNLDELEAKILRMQEEDAQMVGA